MSEFVEKLLKMYNDKALSKEATIEICNSYNLLHNDKAKNASRQKIAVIGIGCRMPEANDKHAFWNNLISKRNSVREFPESRAKDIRPLKQDLDDSLFVEGKEYWRAGYLEGIDEFDAEFFSILPADAKIMDPQQRLFMEIAHETFEDAGYTQRNLSGSKTGIYLGDVHVEYKEIISTTTAGAVVGNVSPFICGRVSRYYNLNGPTVNVSTTCSSSLTAAHLAIKGLLDGDCDLALTGAINLRLFPFFLKNDPVDALNITSPEETCRPFDNSANGIARGEGGGALLLKRYEDSVADGDYIYATIIASEINNDGRSSSVGAPSPSAQAKLISAALNSAKIKPETIRYIEAHGTGTKIGDPIEIQAITKAYGKFTDAKQFCGIGSIKTNIGHLTGGAAGFAGLLKTVLSLKHGKVPASLHFQKPNELINFEESPVYFVDETLDLPENSSTPVRAAVSSFGFNGSNCHMILEQTHRKQQNGEFTGKHQFPFVFSANDTTALQQLLQRHLNAIESGIYNDYQIQDISFTLVYGRDFRSCRAAGLADNLESLAILLRNFLQDKDGEQANIHSNDLLDAFCKGDNVDFSSFFPVSTGGRQYYKVPLVYYPFQKKRHWIDNPRLQWATKLSTSESQEVQLTADAIRQCWFDVLGIQDLNENSDFFGEGGDSLVASQLLANIKKRFNIEIQYRVLAENSTLAAFGNAVLSMSQSAAPIVEETQSGSLSSTYFPLSHSQKRMWAQHYLIGDENVYNMPQALCFNGKYDHENFQNAVNKLIEKNPPLRTVFVRQNKEVVQQVMPSGPLVQVPYLDFSDKTESQLLDYINANVYKKFDLTQLPLFRCFVCRLSEEKHIIVFTIDHIISDGWSLHLMFNSILEIYLGDNLDDDENRSYESYVQNEKKWLDSPDAKRSKQFWINTLSGETPYTEICGDRARPAERNYVGRDIHYTILPSVTKLAGDLFRNTGITLYIPFLASVYILAYQRTNDTDMIIGAPVAGRVNELYRSVLGSFVNVLPVRFQLNLNKDFMSICRELHYVMLDCFEHQLYPFDKLVSELDIKPDMSKNTMFGINVAQQNFTSLERSTPDKGDIEVCHYVLPSITCKWDLHFEFVNEGDQITARLEYSTDMYSDAFAAKLIASHKYLFEKLLANPDTSLESLLSEKEALSIQWN